MRDLEFLVLQTIHNKLVEITGIPSGLVLAKMPDFEFVNKINGSKSAATNDNRFPSIGMKYFDKVRYKANTYGDSYNTDSGDGTGASYTPLGEMSFPISIYLFTETRADQMTIGNIIRREFSKQSFYQLEDDVLTNEYVQVQFIGFNDVQEHRPFVKCFDIICNARDLEETSGYLTNTIQVNLQAQVNSVTVNVDNQNTLVYFPDPPPAELDPDVETYFQDWSVVQVDLLYGGTEERINPD